jgi:hypothetical protein
MNVFPEFSGDNSKAAHAYWSQKKTKYPLIEHLLTPGVTVLEEVLDT